MSKGAVFGDGAGFDRLSPLVSLHSAARLGADGWVTEPRSNTKAAKGEGVGAALCKANFWHLVISP